MLTFTEEEFEKYQNRIAGERQAAKLRLSYQGAVSRAQGAKFEQAIAGACDLYREKGMADIEKTPEPMRPIKRLEGGRFVAMLRKAGPAGLQGNTGRRSRRLSLKPSPLPPIGSLRIGSLKIRQSA